MEKWTQEEQAVMNGGADAAQITAEELSESMAAGAAQQEAPEEDEAKAQEALLDAMREGVGELFEDGWTMQELAAFAQDEGVREAIAKGHGVARAACAYLKAKLSARRHGVPTQRAIAAGGYAAENPLEHMTDEQFDAFSRRAQAAMMAGRKVRL